jgi:hypothetical protein
MARSPGVETGNRIDGDGMNNTPFHGWTESEDRIRECMERRNAQHEAIMKQRQEAEQSASIIIELKAVEVG